MSWPDLPNSVCILRLVKRERLHGCLFRSEDSTLVALIMHSQVPCLSELSCAAIDFAPVVSSYSICKRVQELINRVVVFDDVGYLVLLHWSMIDLDILADSRESAVNLVCKGMVFRMSV